MKSERHGILHRILYGTKTALGRTKTTLVSLAHIPGFLADPAMTQTLYPAEEKKSRAKIRWDLILWALRHAEVNKYYFVAGLDRKRGSPIERFMGGPEGMELIRRSNAKAWTGPRSLDYRCLCKDKFVFGSYLAALGFPTPKVHAIYDGYQLLWLDPRMGKGLESLREVERLDVFCKDALGASGERIFPLRVENGRIFINGQESTLEELGRMMRGPILLQERVTQHPRMASIYPYSINTVRLVTIRRDGDIELFRGFVRCGTNRRPVDNWAAGGIAVGLNPETGRLLKQGVYAPGKGGAVTSHPETGFVFEGFEVPHYQTAVEMAIRLHHFFYGLVTIGWDIAITREGPVFLEGNDWWETRAMQAILGGFKRELLQAIPPPRDEPPNS